MKRFHTLFLIAGASCSFCVQAEAPQPVATLEIGKLVVSTGDVRDASPVFLSDEFLAVLVRSGEPRSGALKIAVLHITSGLQVAASASKANEDDEIRAISGGRVLTASRFHKYLFSPDLAAKQEIPIRVFAGMFTRSGLIGETGAQHWRVLRLSPLLNLIGEGVGELLSVSDDAFVSHASDSIQIHATGSHLLLGSIRVSADAKDSHIAEIAGKGRLYFGSTGQPRIVDFKGQEILSVHPPGGWGFRHGWSSDGSRLLFDHYTRTVSLWDKTLERLVDSLGFSAPEESNGEIVRVIDATSGTVCFDRDSTRKPFGAVGSYHADLSPSGRLVAVASLTDISIDRLPENCNQK